MQVIDLSHPIGTGMPVYPGDPEVHIERALTIEGDGVAVARLHLGSHSGTHADAPSHVVPGTLDIDELPLELFWGEASVLQVSAAGAGAEITREHLAQPLAARLAERVLIATGWDRYFGEESAVQHPHLSLELATELWAAGARVLGVDMLSPDASAPTAAAGGSAQAGELPMGEHAAAVDASLLPVHEFWLGNGGVIIENLRQLTGLPATVEFVGLPLRLAGIDGAPLRAVARIR